MRRGSGMLKTVEAAGLLMAAALTLLSAHAAAAPAPRPDPTAEERGFLMRNATEQGVVTLPGLQYKVLRAGPADGPHPRRTDNIRVRYTGRFLEGRVFNASPDQGRGETVFPLQKLIPGWIAALQMMRPGDVWMLYVPAYLAYGSAGKSYVPADSTLVFQVELVGVEPVGAPSTP